VFLETGREELIFGNVWMLNGTLVFKGLHHFSFRPVLSDVFSDSSGVLEGEELVRSTSIGANWRCYKEPLVIPNNECRARLNHSCLRPIITTPPTDTTSAPFDDWTVLSHPSSHSINIQVYSASSRGSMDLVRFNAYLAIPIYQL
jgi:hypothetical protein